MNNTDTSWQRVGRWYRNLVNKEGYSNQRNIVIPKVLQLLDLATGNSLLDLGCGEGILGRSIPGGVYYQGVDLAPYLVKEGLQSDKQPNHYYMVADVTKPFSLTKSDFSHGVIVLALQNMDNPQGVFSNFQKHLQLSARLVIVINHPYFRIPRQTSWQIDEKNMLQYRRINRYLTPLKIPIQQHPGKGQKSEITWSFHFSLQDYSKFLAAAGFVIEKIEEWVSDKKSVGKAGKMENRARSEFPLFMAISAKKNKITV